MYLTLEEAKDHLRIEHDFTYEDNYIRDAVEAATLVVEKDICKPLAEFEDDGGQLPRPLKQAIKIMLGTYFNTREDEVYGVLVNQTKAYRHIIGLYRDFAG